MAKQKERPGVMLYFDAIRPAIRRMDEAQCGHLLRAAGLRPVRRGAGARPHDGSGL